MGRARGVGILGASEQIQHIAAPTADPHDGQGITVRRRVEKPRHDVEARSARRGKRGEQAALFACSKRFA
jgi:hypothetical protein